MLIGYHEIDHDSFMMDDMVLNIEVEDIFYNRSMLMRNVGSIERRKLRGEYL